jgi:hypothetical protein
MRSLILISLISFFSLTSCSPASSTPPHPQTPSITPTLLGTIHPLTRTPPTATPLPGTCLFRTDAKTEIGLYRFDWQNFTFTIDTKIGPVIIDGPRTLAPGPRRLILIHNTQLSSSFGVTINFDIDGTLIYDPANGAQEIRDAGGSVISQSLSDPLGDANGLPAYLDIVRVERVYGYYPTSTVRVYLGGVRTASQIWTFQSVMVTLGDDTFTRQSFADGKIVVSAADSRGRPIDWPGPATAEDNVVTFALQTGVDQPAGAATATSGGGGDTAGPFPVETMKTVWEAARKFCP